MRRWLMCISLAVFGLLVLASMRTGLGAPPVDADGRPLIKKLGKADLDKVENSLVVFRRQALRL